jgi:hypothetical protein
VLFTLEALNARHGDALLVHYGDGKVVVVDAGPSGVYGKRVKPRLAQVQQASGFGPDDPLPIELVVVSHLDDDHIHGIVDMFSDLSDLRASGEPAPFRVRRLWLNEFDDIIGNQGTELFTALGRAVDSPAGWSGVRPRPEALAVVASVRQGQDVRDAARALNVDLNGNPFHGLVTAPAGAVKASLDGGLDLVVLAPSCHRIEDLQKKWDATLKTQQSEKEAVAHAAAYLDRSVYNLSSIVVLARRGPRTMLLTGDGRGDDILTGLGEAGLLDRGSLHVDILKMPHHGSARDVAPDFFQTITADHYVISADGKYGNPDIATLQMLSQARADNDFSIHLTNPVPHAIAFFDHDRQAGRSYRVEVLSAAESSVRLNLGDSLLI